MNTLKLMLLRILEDNGYALNNDITDIDDVVEYLEICNRDATPYDVYTPDDWFSDTKERYPEYLVKKGE